MLLAFSSLSCAPVHSQEPLEIIGGDAKTIKVEKRIVTYVDATLVSKLPFTIMAPAGGYDYEWSWPDNMKARRKKNTLEIDSAPKGEATVSVAYSLLDIVDGKLKRTDKEAKITFFVGEVAPPEPDPKPPVPPVPPTPAPVGFRVIFVRESSSNMTTEQLHIWNSTKIAAYLNEKAAKDGTFPSWRKFDKDMTADLAPAPLKQLWADAKAKAVAAAPSIIIAVDQKATIHAYPATEDEALALLKKYGG